MGGYGELPILLNNVHLYCINDWNDDRLHRDSYCLNTRDTEANVHVAATSEVRLWDPSSELGYVLKFPKKIEIGKHYSMKIVRLVHD